MNNWTSFHIALAAAAFSASLASGFFFGQYLSTSFDSSASKSSVVEALVEKKFGKKPFQVLSVTTDESAFADFSGNVLESQDQKQYFLVKMDKESDLKSSAIEGGGDVLGVNDLYNVIVDEKGEMETLKLRY